MDVRGVWEVLRVCPMARGNKNFGLRQVLPALKEHRDEFLLKELHRRWDNHKVMVRWLSRFFTYLDR